MPNVQAIETAPDRLIMIQSASCRMFLATEQPYSFGPGPASWALVESQVGPEGDALPSLPAGWRGATRTAFAGTSACARQGLLEVSDQIGCVLYTYRQPQEVGRRGRARTFDRGAVLDEAFDASE